jgi:pimeloyl-ACP methyl ester carboxylesterase
MNRRSFMTTTLLATLAATTGAGATPPTDQDVPITVFGVEIACRLTRPAGEPKGAVLLLPGSLYSDVDGNYPTMNMHPHAYADLAAQLGARGFAVLRMAKIGPGTGSKTIDATLAARHADFLARVDVASAGLARLRAAVPARPLIVAGHSEGAVVAALLAAGPDAASIDGVVSLSGPSVPLLAIMREQMAAMGPPGTPADLTVFDQAIAAIRTGAPLPPAAATDPMAAMLAHMPPAAFAYIASIDRIVPLAAIAKARQPLLIVQGGHDLSVRPHHADALKAARGPLPTATAFFPTLTHFYKVAPADLPPMANMALTTDSDPAVADAIAHWARGLRV